MAVLNTKKMEAREIPQSKQNKKDEKKKTLLIAQELKIARSLAGNEKVYRDRALKSLKKWFRGRVETLAFTEEDFLRLWKGLFYSMWMSDKPLIQEECAENIASLLHELPIDHSLVLFKCGLITLCKEWFGIDQLRLDKFMMFVRRLLRQALVVLKKNGFKKDSIVEFGKILSMTVLDSEKKDILGLFMHLTEIFLEELAKVGEGNLKPHLVNEFLLPFMEALALTDDPRKIKQLRKYIFIHLMSQSEVGLEYQERYEAWKRQGFPGTIHGMQKVETEDDGNIEEDSDDEIHSPRDKPLDPRAGRVDVELPQISFNAKAVADLLIKCKYVKGSTVAGRKALMLLSKQFRKLSKGIYPIGVVDLRLPKDDIKDMNVRKAVNRLVKFEKKLMGDNSKSRKTKSTENNDELPSKKQKLVNESDSSQKTKSIENIDQLPSKKQKHANKNELLDVKDNDCDVSDEDAESYIMKNLHKYKTNKEGKKVIDIPRKFLKQGLQFRGDPSISTVTLPDYLLSESGQIPEVVFEKFSGLWRVYDDVPNGPDKSLERAVSKPEVSKKKTEKPVNDKKKTDKIISNGIQKKKNSKTKNVQKKATMMKAIQSYLENERETKKQESKDTFAKNPWDEPLKEGEYEVLIPTKSYVDKLKKISKKSTMNLQELIDNSLVKFKNPKELRKEAMCSTPERAKKVKIDTSLNQSQDFDEYHSQMLSSPAIVFDGSKKPGKPLLKSRKPTPINPFYKKLKL